MSQTACWATNELDVCAKVYFGYGSLFDMMRGYPHGYQLSLRGVIALVRCDYQYSERAIMLVNSDGQREYKTAESLTEYLSYPMKARMDGSPIHIEHPEGEEEALKWYAAIEKETGYWLKIKGYFKQYERYYKDKPMSIGYYTHDLLEHTSFDDADRHIFEHNSYSNWNRWLDLCGTDGQMVKRAEYFYEQASASNSYISTTGIEPFERTESGKPYRTNTTFDRFEKIAVKRLPDPNDFQDIVAACRENYIAIYHDDKQDDTWSLWGVPKELYDVHFEGSVFKFYFLTSKADVEIPSVAIVEYDLQRKYEIVVYPKDVQSVKEALYDEK